MKVMVFAPFAGIWQHAFPEATIASTLANSGCSIYYVTCNQIFQDSCMTMSACGQTYLSTKKERQDTCSRCIKNKEIILEYFQFHETPLSNYLDNEDIKVCEKIVSLIDKDNLLEYQYEGIPVGKAVLSSIILETKKNNFNFSSSEIQKYLIEIKNCLFTLVALNKIYSQIKPERVLIYNTQFPTNYVAAKLASKLNISVYYMHSGMNLSNRLQRLVIGRNNYKTIFNEMFLAWKNGKKNVPVFEEACNEVTEHYLTLISGNNPLVYSSGINSNAEIRKIFSIPDEKKIVLITLSSYDELMAAQATGTLPYDIPMVFSSQIEWVRETSEFISQYKNLFLIIRVHPREFPNRRESVVSDHARQLQKVFRVLPSNACVNWPTDGISIYDFPNEIALSLNFISSVGKELTLMGVPVLSYAPKEYLFYPNEILTHVTTKESYFKEMLRLLDSPFEFNKIRILYRWYALEFCYSTLKINTPFSQAKVNNSPNIFERILNKSRRIIQPYYKQVQDCKQFNKCIEQKSALYDLLKHDKMSLLSCEMYNSGEINKENEDGLIMDSLTVIYRLLYGETAARSRIDAYAKS